MFAIVSKMTGSSLYLRLMRYAAPYRGMFALAILATVIVALTLPALPAIVKPLLDGTFVGRDATVTRWIPWLIVGLFLVRGLAEYVASYAMTWVGNKVVMDLRTSMFARLLELPTRYYDDHATGVLISKLTFDVTQVNAAATTVFTALFKDAISIAGLLAWMLWVNWKLTLLSLVMTPLIVLIVRLVSVRLRNTSREVQNAMGALTQVVQETAEGHKVVKIFGGQRYEAARFETQANRVRHLLMKQTAAAAASVPFVQLTAAIALAVMVSLAAGQSGANEITVGGFVSFIAAMLMLTAPLKRVTSVNEPLQRGLAAAESVFELIDQPGERDPGSTGIARARGELRFENVSFTYGDPRRPVLDAVSLAIAPGETVALVGSSGAGKTTLAHLVPAFYRPSAGRVLLDGYDLAHLKLAELRANIALVGQDVVLFNDTVGANIAYGAVNGAAQADILAAAQAAHALEFIDAMPEGMNTPVGENGVKLSGGQRQRIAIARALLKNAPVLVLDEATSALDSESERHVQAALETLIRGRTTLVIAHRLSTVENADRIVVLEAGRVVEMGTHAQLLAGNGRYARLYRMQFARDAEAA
jgi:subfamily B ATP-binding cassette protein MsbA